MLRAVNVALLSLEIIHPFPESKMRVTNGWWRDVGLAGWSETGWMSVCTHLENGYSRRCHFGFSQVESNLPSV